MNIAGTILHTTGTPRAAVSVFQQWAERWVDIQGGPVIGRGIDVRLESWVNTIEVRLGMLPTGSSMGTAPAHASSHSVKTYGSKRREFHVPIRRVEQPARQGVRGFQVQRPPGPAFSQIQMLSRTVTYRGTLAPSGASLLYTIAPSGVSKLGAMILALT